MERHRKRSERAQSQTLQKLPPKKGSEMVMGLKAGNKQREEAEKKGGTKFF